MEATRLVQPEHLRQRELVRWTEGDDTLALYDDGTIRYLKGSMFKRTRKLKDRSHEAVHAYAAHIGRTKTTI